MKHGPDGMAIESFTLACEHVVAPEGDVQMLQRGWYAAVKCPDCRRRRRVVSARWTSLRLTKYDGWRR